ncbi:MAG: hypothetical protein GF388_03215, partial [Candidatus Aegiribacteria sp.]|nr:hypothetical protein [Candidatus Aegiribacteria sp.]MBD3294278.1 hypothetical protein [Candidatus Fermentibacteria bacterium]
MLNLIPRFIHDKYRENSLQGDFECSALMIDITGFTGITDLLMERGKEGAEDVSELINRIYRPLIDSVYSGGGFITGFAGDGFTAIYPKTEDSNSALSALITARQMQSTLQKRNGSEKSLDPRYSITARIGISRGRATWQILGSSRKKTYLFAGDAIASCTNALKSCKPGDVLLDEKALSSIENEGSNALADNGKSFASAHQGRVENSIVRRFVPDEVIH